VSEELVAATQMEPGDDDFITPEEAKKLLEGNLFPIGQYVVKATGFEALPFEEGQGGYKLTALISSAPTEAPEGGWRPVVITFRRWEQPTEPQKTMQRMDREAMTKMFAAFGVDVAAGFAPKAAGAVIVGVEALATSTHRAGAKKDESGKKVLTGKSYQQWDFAPITN
jgi:hypothetical protein